MVVIASTQRLLIIATGHRGSHRVESSPFTTFFLTPLTVVKRHTPFGG
jgi:hypothetical protein